MSETLHEMAVRMSGGRCGKGCAGCPAHAARYSVGGGCLVRILAKFENVDEQIEGLKKWAEEYPMETWLDMFRKAFPNAPRRGDGAPQTCPEALYGSVAENRGCTNGCYDGTCLECWNREITNK